MKTFAKKGFRFKHPKLGVLAWPNGSRYTTPAEAKAIKDIPPEYPVLDRNGAVMNPKPEKKDNIKTKGSKAVKRASSASKPASGASRKPRKKTKKSTTKKPTTKKE